MSSRLKKKIKKITRLTGLEFRPSLELCHFPRLHKNAQIDNPRPKGVSEVGGKSKVLLTSIPPGSGWRSYEEILMVFGKFFRQFDHSFITRPTTFARAFLLSINPINVLGQGCRLSFHTSHFGILLSDSRYSFVGRKLATTTQH